MFQPDSGCEYFQYTRSEVLEYFQVGPLNHHWLMTTFDDMPVGVLDVSIHRDPGMMSRKQISESGGPSSQAEATDILVVGDSFMRQLFVRLLHLLRGQVQDFSQGFRCSNL